MESVKVNNKICPICSSEYSSVSAKNKHMKNIHKQPNTCLDKKSRIICPLCIKNELLCGTYAILEKHLETNHKIKLEMQLYPFANEESFKKWFEDERLEMQYVSVRSTKHLDYVEKSYHCNRSNSSGFESKATKRLGKAGGSIKMYGVCPSHINVKIRQTGEIIVKFWKTHVGHKDEIRTQHLSNSDKSEIVKKLCSGVTVDRIISDARKPIADTLQRINILNRKDISYLSKKHNILKRKHENAMIAVALKVKEWNTNGKNYCFFFKQQGETHRVLQKEDFCLGFMNDDMESKLKKFHRIICMDGTHGTNKNGMDLTVMLIKDERNMGFPVAFFALQEKIKLIIQPEFFMTDDDPKYWNAWVKVMGTTPRRLLCSWHIMKNWVIQGRSKIKNIEIKKNMKMDLKKILNETKLEKFKEVSNKYFEKLQNAKEYVFLNYLTQYYFQSNERIAMWAHCYRLNSGINTNMALESLNNLLKTNQLKRKCNITLDRLLDEIENLVDGKMWQRILKIERPHSNIYQDRLVIKSHKLAENMKIINIKIIEVGFGEFKVKSSRGNNFYNIKFNEFCATECRNSYCRICKVCIHRYKCDCIEFSIKTTLCKHIHLICLYEKEKGSDSVLDDTTKEVIKSSDIMEEHKNEMNNFLEVKKSENQDFFVGIDGKTRRAVQVETIANCMLALNDEEFNK